MNSSDTARDPIAEARAAIDTAPMSARAHRNMAQRLERAGEMQEAEAHYREAALLQPETAQPWRELAAFHLRRRKPDRAEAVYLDLAERGPHRDLAEMSLGNLCRRRGDPERAAGWYNSVLKRDPANAAAHNALGTLAADRNAWRDAAEHYRAALSHSPRFADALTNLGAALARMGQPDAAIQHHRAALKADPKLMKAYINLAVCLGDLGQKAEAETVFRDALEAGPGYLPALVNLANLLNDTGRPDEAIELYRQAIDTNPHFAPTYSNLAGLLKDQGRVEEAIATLEKALSLMSDFPEAASNLLLTLNYSAERSPRQIAEAHFRIGRDFVARAGPRTPHRNAAKPDKRLRVGYVSSDFRTHPVAFFMEPILRHHDPDAVEVFGYANQTRDDETTARLRPLVGHWRSIGDLPDAAADALIRADGIDILVDLSGHTARNRIALFARKPAPVQIGYLGYPATTGLPTMDYRITDARADPEGMSEDWHSETLLRLPDCFLCYRPPPDCPDPASPPDSAPGAVTFASFNNPAKLSPQVIALWARILAELPDASLVMKAQPFADPGPRQHFSAMFEEHGIDPARIRFAPRTDTIAEHLDLYRTIDIALDSFPYNGTTITCEAFYMGVPVVIREGEAHVARVGSSIAHAIGAAALVASDDEGYVSTAVALARDPEKRAEWRKRLRPMMKGSPLMDEPRFVRNLESAYRGAWRRWCAARDGET